MKIQPPNYTQTPNDLLDHWLPHLTEVELKVLLVVIRKTFGWHKIKDRISLSQLESITGSTQKSIIGSVNSLIEKGLIRKEVVGPNGQQRTYYELIVNDDSNISYPCNDYRGPCNENRGTPVMVTDTKETLTKETYQKKQQQQSSLDMPPRTAAASFRQAPSPEPIRITPNDCTLRAYFTCLEHVEIPEADKLEISKRYDSKTVQNAIAWATHPQTKLTKGLVQAIKWACQNKPEVPKQAKDEIAENKAYAKRFDGVKIGSATVSVLNTYVEIEYGTPYKPTTAISYEEKGFREQLDSAIRKIDRGASN